MRTMQCDVCNTAITSGAGEQITPDVFTYLIDNGFGLDETNIKMLTDTGISRSAAEDALSKRAIPPKQVGLASMPSLCSKGKGDCVSEQRKVGRS